jgi:RNA polymerase sigma-70 factor (ECF subfamily)
MSASADDFSALLFAVSRGDQQAAARLSQQYESKVRIVARVLLGPALRPYLDSIDMVQSVHRSLLMGLRHDKFDISSPEKLIALATTMVRRKVARQWRHLRRQQRLENGNQDSANLAHTLSSLSSTETDPARAAQFNEQVEHLCSRLDPVERRILELRSEGYSTAEIAEQLSLKAVTLRVRMTRLRERLLANGLVHEWL